jgi:hypothetical protein
LSLGLPSKKLGFGKEFISAVPFLSKFLAKEAK